MCVVSVVLKQQRYSNSWSSEVGPTYIHRRVDYFNMIKGLGQKMWMKSIVQESNIWFVVQPFVVRPTKWHKRIENRDGNGSRLNRDQARPAPVSSRFDKFFYFYLYTRFGFFWLSQPVPPRIYTIYIFIAKVIEKTHIV